MENKKPKLILHIGANKTATSSVQKFASDYRKHFLKEGLNYPDCGKMYYGHHGIATMASLSSTEIKKNKVVGYRQAKFKFLEGGSDLKDDMYKEAVENNYITLLSSETFMQYNNPSQVKKYFNEFDISVVFYVRDYVSFLSSWYQQVLVSQNYAGNFRKFTEEAFVQKTKFYEIIKNWTTVFGDNVIVSKYDVSELHNKNIISDFFHKINVSLPSKANYNNYFLNNSVTGNLLYFKKIINKNIDKVTSSQISDEIQSLSEHKSFLSSKGKLQISKSDVEYVQKTFKSDSDMLKSEYNIDFSDLEHNNENATPSPIKEDIQTDFDKCIEECIRTDKRLYHFLIRAKKDIFS